MEKIKMETRDILLGVNIDHIATLRQARGTRYPDPLRAVMIAEQAGADGITMHLREDRRHIQDRDVLLVKEVLQTRLNLEMAVTDEMLDFALRIRPEACCLVPERREELTTEGGLDIVSAAGKIREACRKLADAGVEVSLFIDADLKQIDAALAAGAPVIELHTGCYADAESKAGRLKELERIREAAEYARQAGLRINAGHGLNLHNVEAISRIEQITELNIGHSLIAEALFCGLERAVREMKRVMREARLHI